VSLSLTRADFERAYAKVAPHIHHTPLLSSRMLSEATGFDVRLKAEIFQRTGSYKIRGPLNKFTHLTEEERQRGVVCSSAGNHAQGVAAAAALHGVPAPYGRLAWPRVGVHGGEGLLLFRVRVSRPFRALRHSERGTRFVRRLVGMPQALGVRLGRHT